LPCDISLDDSIQGCSEGEEGCRAVEKTTELPPATVNGSISCSVSGSGGWCRGGAALSLSGSEPLSGYNILTLEGTRNGEPFACSGAACGVPLLEGNNAFAFWARSSYGDTSSAGSADGKLDSAAPTISGEATGSAGDADWFVSEVTVSASANDGAPGSGLTSFELSINGSEWGAYSGPIVLSDGEHTVNLRASDAAGNSPQESLEVRIDTQPPTIDLGAGSSFCPGCGQALDIDVSVQDAGSGIVEWTLTAGGASVASGSTPIAQTFSWGGSGLGGGSHTLTLEARDEAGNTAATSEPFVLILPTAEPAPTQHDANESAVQGSTSAVATATLSAGAPPTVALQPTRAPVSIPFGVLPAAPLPSTGEEPAPGVSSGSAFSSESGSTSSGSSSGPVFGAAALALIAAASAFTLDRLRRRQEEEAALRQEMARRNEAAEIGDRAKQLAMASRQSSNVLNPIRVVGLVAAAAAGVGRKVGRVLGKPAPQTEAIPHLEPRPGPKKTTITRVATLGGAVLVAALTMRNCAGQNAPRLCTGYAGGVEVQYLCNEAEGSLLQKSTATPNPTPTPMFSCTDPGRNGTNAYENAKAGGRHSNYYRQAITWAAKSLFSALDRHEQNVAEHLAKIADPLNASGLRKPWHTMDPREQAGILEDWCDDMRRNREQADVIYGVLRERGELP
jgi:hypothetical protein